MHHYTITDPGWDFTWENGQKFETDPLWCDTDLRLHGASGYDKILTWDKTTQIFTINGFSDSTSILDD